MANSDTWFHALKDITSFSAKLREVKFAEFSTLSEKQIAALDDILNTDIPQLMEVRMLDTFNCLCSAM